MDGLLFYVITLIILLLLSAFFSGAEAALFSLSRSQIRRLEKESPAGALVERLLSRPRNLLVTILIGNMVVNVIATSAATAVSVAMFGARGIFIAFAFMSVLILVFGEILPKVIAMNRPRKYSMLIAYPLRFCHLLFLPARIPLARLSGAVIEYLKKHLGKARNYFSREELLTAIDLGRGGGHLEDFEHEILSNVIDFRYTVVREIMTPRFNVFSLPIELRREDLVEKFRKSGYSRVPMYGETQDDILGIFHIKDLTRISGKHASEEIKTFLRPPLYIPDSSLISELFKELTQQKMHMAVVIDEYGSFVGVVTMEDILEELVGEIRDAREPRTRAYDLLEDGRIIVLGSMDIDEFNEVFKTDIVDEEHETLAGYVIGAIGSIPREGETIELGTLRFHIISSRPNRIKKMRVEKR